MQLPLGKRVFGEASKKANDRILGCGHYSIVLVGDANAGFGLSMSSQKLEPYPYSHGNSWVLMGQIFHSGNHLGSIDYVFDMVLIVVIGMKTSRHVETEKGTRPGFGPCKIRQTALFSTDLFNLYFLTTVVVSLWLLPCYSCQFLWSGTVFPAPTPLSFSKSMDPKVFRLALQSNLAVAKSFGAVFTELVNPSTNHYR